MNFTTFFIWSPRISSTSIQAKWDSPRYSNRKDWIVKMSLQLQWLYTTDVRSASSDTCRSDHHHYNLLILGIVSWQQSGDLYTNIILHVLLTNSKEGMRHPPLIPLWENASSLPSRTRSIEHIGEVRYIYAGTCMQLWRGVSICTSPC